MSETFAAADSVPEDLEQPYRRTGAGSPAVLYIDRHLVHEVTSPQAFHRAARARFEGSPPGPHHRHRRSRHPHPRCPATAARLTGLFYADELSPQANRPDGSQLRRVRHPALRAELARPGHRPRDRPRTGSDPAGHDHRVRRFAHLHPRRFWRAGIWHRHQRGRARSRHAVPAAARAENHGNPPGRRASSLM